MKFFYNNKPKQNKVNYDESCPLLCREKRGDRL